MDLDSDFMEIQGVFLNLHKEIGDFNEIQQASGNKKSILRILAELHKLLSSKNYIKNDEINKVFDDKINNIVLFLILNTNLHSDLQLDQHSHLTNILPNLSKCLLANLIIGLNLSEQYCKALEPLPLLATEELLAEMLPCLKKAQPTAALTTSKHILKLIMLKLTNSSRKQSDDCDKLTSLASAILLNLTEFSPQVLQKQNLDIIYVHLGHTIAVVLHLLQQCDTENDQLHCFIGKLLQTCWSLLMNVSLDIFCAWAEVGECGETLQNEVAGEAYLVLEKYQKYAPAKDLVLMLGNVAQKPISVRELIHLSDEKRMIAMVEKGGADQTQWFQALFNKLALDSAAWMACVRKWAHLCTEKEALVLLSQTDKSREVVVLALQCAGTLSIEDLRLVSVKHFYKNGISHNLSAGIEAQLTVIFNKLKNTRLDEDLAKELHLLLLQNPEQFLSFVVGECMKSTFYSEVLGEFLVSLKQVLMVGNVGLRVLSEEMGKNQLGELNIKNYVELFNLVITGEVYSVFVVCNNVLLPILDKTFREEQFQGLKYVLEIITKLKEPIILSEESEAFYGVIFDVMVACRCKFLAFDRLKHEIVRDCVAIIEKCTKKCCNLYKSEIILEKKDFFARYYALKLTEGADSIPSFMQHHFPTLQFSNHAETVTRLIKIIPLCVCEEWLMLGSGLQIVLEPKAAAETFADCLMLLCQVIATQEENDENKELVESMVNGMKCCLQNYGNLIKDVIKPKITKPDEEVALAYCICRLVHLIPDELKSEEGLSLVCLISDETLKSLRNDKKFACIVAAIKDPHVVKFMVQKILNQS